MADDGYDGDTVRLPPVLFQPMAADDVATAGRVAAAQRHGRDRRARAFRFDDLIREPSPPATTLARSSPTPMPATSAPSSTSAASSRANELASPRPASRTGSASPGRTDPRARYFRAPRLNERHPGHPGRSSRPRRHPSRRRAASRQAVGPSIRSNENTITPDRKDHDGTLEPGAPVWTYRHRRRGIRRCGAARTAVGGRARLGEPVPRGRAPTHDRARPR